jgi:protein-L-isoaspartate(D-aspartate) O-methyltransferase
VKKAQRNLLLRIDAEFEQTAMQTGCRAPRPELRAALGSVPREAFVPERDRANAYDNRPLPIGHGATISQPFVVALMIELLDPDPEDTVLEIGTGSGYAAALISRLVRKVYSMEVVPQLAEGARDRLAALGYDNVEVRCGDGYEGWPEHAPYDAFLIAAAAPRVPEVLVAQLRDGGRFVLPVGEVGELQELVVGRRGPGGDVRERRVLPVAFVPMVQDRV